MSIAIVLAAKTIQIKKELKFNPVERDCISSHILHKFRPYGHGQATRKGFGANLLFNEHGGFRPLMESTLGTILRYPYYFIITAVRSLGERFARGR